MIRRAAIKLGLLLGRVVFVGGAAVDLLITDAGLQPTRLTKDVDAIAEIVGRPAFGQLEEELRQVGFQHDMGSHVICRWRFDDMIFDLMPTDDNIFGFGNQWYLGAYRSAISTDLGEHLIVRSISAPYFLATKIEAFYSAHRTGGGDFLASHDLSDIVYLFNGRKETASDVASADGDVRDYIRVELRRLLESVEFLEGIYAHLEPDRQSQLRHGIIVDRMRNAAEV